VQELSRCSDANGELKTRMILALGYVLKTTAKVMTGKYLIEDKDDKARDVDNFTTVLNLKWEICFVLPDTLCHATDYFVTAPLYGDCVIITLCVRLTCLQQDLCICDCLWTFTKDIKSYVC